MHYRPGQSMTFDIDGLQADVMRFMAIIAFCLIAILALVQDVESPLPAPKDELVPEPILETPQAQTVEEIVSIADVEPIVPEPREFISQPAREPLPELMPVFNTEPARVPVQIPEPQTVYQERPQTIYQEPPQTIYQEQPQTIYQEQPQTIYQEQPQALYEEQPQALALRFVSDDAFVALISTAKIQLFAHAENEYYRMGANFGVTQAPAVGALYELLPTSIPGKISRIFKRVVRADGYLVALPVDMQDELNRFLHNIPDETQKGGTLVIHRNGHLSYEK